ncbi:MAG: hypothetical protein CMJ45_07850 [Planctomyces sp.]|nr:hypothetical protein [Planctomyces sp.]
MGPRTSVIEALTSRWRFQIKPRQDLTGLENHQDGPKVEGHRKTGLESLICRVKPICQAAANSSEV